MEIEKTETRANSWVISLLIYAVATVTMYWFRIVAYPGDVISLTYALPLLLCIWHQDRRLLWAMTLTFAAMATYKNLFLITVLSDNQPGRLLQWSMQMANTFLVAGIIHAILDLLQRLRLKNARLEQTNRELSERDIEITRQNEELHAQTEELAQQNEEIQQQNEEIQQQSEELHQQAEELQTQAEQLRIAHDHLRRRENMLQTLLHAIRIKDGEEELPPHICDPLIELFDGAAAGAKVVELRGEQLIVLAEAGGVRRKGQTIPYHQSIASIVIESERTAFIEDMRDRPDLDAPETPRGPVRSILATPLRFGDRVVGAVAAYSLQPRSWTQDEFRIIEWAAVQCELLLTARRLQRRLTDANANLDQLVQKRTAELQEVINELEHFSYTIAHDLRAPLRALQGYSGLLAESANSLDDECLRFLERIASAAARMDHLITDSLAYSRTVSGEMPLVPVDPEHLLRGIIDSYPMLQHPKAEIVIEGNLPRVLANEAGLTQCFSNLLGNAVKFVQPGKTPHLRIWADNGDEFTRFYIEDNGIGIPPEMHDRIFGMFQRANRNYEGTGIGLALVRKVISRMGGKVGVDSEPDRGSRFWLDLKPVNEYAATTTT